jgi:predicted RNA binding protein YcfA (HicA-like mRNA interferase family)
VSKLPTQLRWDQFVGVLKVLGFEQLTSKGGSAMHFVRSADGEIQTFHRPHRTKTIPQGTLTEYIRHLKITREEFTDALSGVSRNQILEVVIAEEERFRRTSKPDGVIVSNCCTCLDVVLESLSVEEITAAELAHPCYPTSNSD